MPHSRREDQTVEAFSLPKSLLLEAKARAGLRNMTKSGYFRYCLAREMGYSEAEAVGLGQHRAVSELQRTSSVNYRSGSVLNAPNLTPGAVAKRMAGAGADEAKRALPERPPLSATDEPSAQISPPRIGSAQRSSRRPVAGGQTQAGPKAGKE